MTDWGRLKGFRTLPILIVCGHFHSWWMTIFSRFFILWYISREFWRISWLLLGLYLFLHDEAVKLTLRPEWSSHAHEKHLSLTPENCVKFFRYDRLLWKYLPLDGSTSWILVLQVQITSASDSLDNVLLRDTWRIFRFHQSYWVLWGWTSCRRFLSWSCRAICVNARRSAVSAPPSHSSFLVYPLS